MSFRCLNSFCNDAPGNSSCRGDAANVAGSKGTVEHDNTSTLSAMHVCKRLFKCHHTISRQNGGQTGSTIAHKHTLPQGATCYSVACLLSAIQPNSNAIRKASRVPITGTRCRHCTHVLTHVVHSQTGSHAPSRIIPSCSPAARCDSSGGTIPHFGDSCTRQLSSLRNPTSSVTFEPFFHLRIRNMTGAEPSRVSVVYSCAIDHLLSGRSGGLLAL